MKENVLTKQNKSEHKFSMLLSIPVKTRYLKHLCMFFGRASVTCVDADLNKHKSWSRAQQHHKQEVDELNRGMLRPHGCRLSYQAHTGTSAGTKFPLMQTLLCCIQAPSQSNVHLLLSACTPQYFLLGQFVSTEG